MSVTLVTHQGMRWLAGCIASVQAQEVSAIELLVLDNASTDGTAERLDELAALDPWIRVQHSARNLGYAAGHNRLLAEAAGEFVLLLNQDVELDPAFLRHALAAFDGRPRLAAVQARVRHLGRDGQRTATLDSTGLEVHRDRRIVSRAQGHPDGHAHEAAGPVFGADGPVPVYRRAALLDARLPGRGGWEILDEDFFMYKEDVDLAWRLQRLGWQAWYAPKALAWHARGAGGPRTHTLREIVRVNRALPGWVRQRSWRNHRLMMVKNEPLGSFLRDLPWIARREALSVGYLVLADPATLRSVIELLRALPWAMRKRRYLARRLARRHSAT